MSSQPLQHQAKANGGQLPQRTYRINNQLVEEARSKRCGHHNNKKREGGAGGALELSSGNCSTTGSLVSPNGGSGANALSGSITISNVVGTATSTGKYSSNETVNAKSVSCADLQILMCYFEYIITIVIMNIKRFNAGIYETNIYSFRPCSYCINWFIVVCAVAFVVAIVRFN